MSIRRFEQRLENLVEGTFARVFRAGLAPVDIGRHIVREIDANQTMAVDGALAVPNHYWVFLAGADHARFEEVKTPLTNELIEAARAHIADEGYRLLGPVSVTLVEAADYPEGNVQVQAQWREGIGRTSASLRLSTGERFPVGQRFTVGRLPGGSLVLRDDNVSRTHAVIEKAPSGWVIRDLGSTNGTTVNGQPITQAQLSDGDAITFGSTEATFALG